MVQMTDGFEPTSEYSQDDAGVNVAARAGVVARILGAATSLAILAGAVVWGYQLVVRDATGIPVVRAMAGPMREAPSDPGGELALHTGLAVNAVAAMGEAAPPEDMLILAPATADLTEEDLEVVPTDKSRVEAEVPLVAAEITSRTSPDTPLSATDILALADAISADAFSVEGDPADVTPISEAPISEAPISEAPVLQTVAEPVATPEVAADLAADRDNDNNQAIPEATDEVTALLASLVLPDSAEGLTRSLRPMLRPGTVVIAAAEVPGTETIAVSTRVLPVGTSLVQLGAFETAEIAVSEWGRLANRFDDFMVGKEPLIQRAESGGVPFFRLRAIGFEDMADARRFCSALSAEDAPCIPVLAQ